MADPHVQNASFVVGRLLPDDAQRIQLAPERPAFIRSIMIDERARRDSLGVDRALNELLRSEEDAGAIRYWPVDAAADAYQIAGGYRVEGSSVTLEVILYHGQDEVARIESVEVKLDSPQVGAAESVAESVLEHLRPSLEQLEIETPR